MFGHFKTGEFLDSIEGGSLPEERRAHLNACTTCMTQLRSVEAAYRALSSQETDIPEPDWNEFRASVRTELLSRSIQRESAIRRWTGWPIRSAMAWALSFLFLLGVSVGSFYWHVSKDAVLTTTVQEITLDTGSEEASWTPTSYFDELSDLEEPQVERLRLLLESAQKGTLGAVTK